MSVQIIDHQLSDYRLQAWSEANCDSTQLAPSLTPTWIPLAQWQIAGESPDHDSPQAAWIAAGHGVVVDGGCDPAELQGLIAGGLQDIAISFKAFTDGRGFSVGHILRRRLRFRGRLWALGEIIPDQLLSLQRCGFNAFALPERFDPAKALAQLQPFDGAYQTAIDQQLPRELQALGAQTLRAAGATDSTLTSDLSSKLQALDQRLQALAQRYPRAGLASSLSPEDMLITDRIAALGLPIQVFTLNTGRLHDETLEVIDAVRSRYGLNIHSWHPRAEAVAGYITQYGLDGFYDSLEARKACCHVRKVEPLQRALKQYDAWLTGQRREQSVTRGELPFEEDDASHGLKKFNPIADWSSDEVWAVLRAHQVPYNALHDRQFPSIGCAPCTRAVAPGEPDRAGRWWWENPEHKECGLHVGPDGRLQRVVKVVAAA